MNYNPQAAKHIASKPDRYYKNLLKASGLAQVPVAMMRVAIIATDAEGNETGRYEGWSRTYVRNFYNYLMIGAGNLGGTGTGYVDGNLTVRNTAGAIAVGGSFGFSGTSTAQQLSIAYWASTVAAVGIDTLGIVVGTGSTPESFNSFALTAKLSHGITAGTISYQAASVPVPSWDTTLRRWSVVSARIFNNNSGGPLTITECAAYARWWGGNVSNDSLMLWRDLLASPVTVANGGQLTVTYTQILQFPLDVVEQPPMGGARKDQFQRQVSDAWEVYHTPRTRLSPSHYQNSYTAAHYMQSLRYHHP
jgi:hypothetical protein